MGKTYWGVMSAAVEQSRRQTNGCSGRREIQPQRLTPESQKKTKKSIFPQKGICTYHRRIFFFTFEEINACITFLLPVFEFF